MENKGVLGLDTAKLFFLAILTLGVIGFSLIIVLDSINSTPAAQKEVNGNSVNETFAFQAAGTTMAVDARAIITNVIVTNITSGVEVNVSNYTVSNRTITGVAGSLYNGHNTNASYSFIFTDQLTQSITGNISSGTVSFFGNASTWFALLAIVIIILVITVVIVAVNRFGGRGSSGL